MRSAILVLSILFLGFRNPVSDLSGDELQAISSAYKGDFTLSLKGKYRYYPIYDSREASDSLESKTVIHGNSYYFSISEYEFIYEDGYYVFVDNESKVVSVTRTAAYTGTIQYDFLNTLIQNKDCTLSEFDAGSKDKGLTITFRNQDITRADLIIDSQTNWIKKCTLKYFEGIDYQKKSLMFSRLEITYSDYQKSNTPFPSATYGISHYIAVHDTAVSLVGAYKTYKLNM